MRIRSILPDFYRSEDVGAMDWHTRLVFIGLWSYVDDNGVGRDVLSLIVGDLFPFDVESPETVRRVSTALSWLSEHGQIKRYKVNGKPYLFVVNWDKYQRVQNPAKSRYPRPTCDDIEPPEDLQRVSVESPETLPPGEGEEGRRGEEKPSSSAEPPRAEVAYLCDLLADLIEGNGSRRPNVGKTWHDSARLMLDRDKRDPDEAERLIRWCQADQFWHSNVLSMPKFREQYDKLRLKSQSSQLRVVNGRTVNTGRPRIDQWLDR